LACFRVLAAKIGDLPVTIITVYVFIKPFEPEYSRQINFCSGCLELVFWFRLESFAGEPKKSAKKLWALLFRSAQVFCNLSVFLGSSRTS
jgi:hypothetical protein